MAEERRRVMDAAGKAALLADLRRELDAIYQDHPMNSDRQIINAIYTDLAAIKALQEAQTKDLNKVTEILGAWDNAKGFVKTIRIIAEVAKWLVVVSGTFAIIYYWFKQK